MDCRKKLLTPALKREWAEKVQSQFDSHVIQKLSEKDQIQTASRAAGNWYSRIQAKAYSIDPIS